jgi:glutamate-1-semialdehyde 2,1-aminomutase
MGVVPPAEGFLGSLREICTDQGALLLFDEVITGFRIAYGGAQSRYGVTPDLTAVGKVMGGGFPCAAFGGRREVMEQLAPTGPVYQAGTLSGNPVAVAAGIAALDLAKELDPYAELAATAERLTTELGEILSRNGVSTAINRVESLFSVLFTEEPVRNYQQARAADHERYGRFFHHMLGASVYLPPSGYELWTLGTAHGEAEIAAILHAAASFAG